MLTVKEVKTRADKKRFIQFQNDLYKDTWWTMTRWE